MGYDIIGDVHGQADKLVALLTGLGYRERDGAWRHAERSAIFVGDLIDRGPKQRETVDLVRRMVDRGSALAILGNHEFNAIAYRLRDPVDASDTLRPRLGRTGEKNTEQHEAFLAAVGCDSPLHDEYVDWFLTLPLWLDLPELRVVHACWHPGYMAELESALAPGRRLTPELVAAASRKGRIEYRTVEGLAKGIEVPLPDGYWFEDKDGHRRTEIRVRWWEPAGATYRQAAIVDEAQRDRIPDLPMPPRGHVGYDDAKPVFFGHYWMTGAPTVLAPRIACVDYSAGKEGDLVAYRWDGEPTLDASRFATSNGKREAM
jgi:hypothetical protein